jgi:Gpi18-like mannosyltransferase
MTEVQSDAPGSVSRAGGRPGLRRSPAVRAVVYAFVLTRLLVMLVLVVGGQVNAVTTGTSDTTREMYLRLDKVPVSRVLRATVQTADVNWYHGIAAEGYERRPFDVETHHNWAFFPVFPLLWRAAGALTGELLVTGVVLSNALLLAALFLVYGAAREFGLDDSGAERAVFYLAAFPTSYFFSLPLTESLFLGLAAGSLYAARRRAWWLAGLLGALASGTRVVGVLLLPALAILHLQTYGRGFWRRPDVLWLCLVPAGLVSFMLYLHALTGNAFAFKDALVAWGRRPGFFLLTLFEYLKEPSLVAAPWDFRLLNFLAPVLALACGVALLRRREWALAAFTLLLVTAALSSNLLQSQARYAMVAFPMYFVAARVAAGRPRLDLTIRAVSLVLLALMCALFAGHFSVAMS